VDKICQDSVCKVFVKTERVILITVVVSQPMNQVSYVEGYAINC